MAFAGSAESPGNPASQPDIISDIFQWFYTWTSELPPKTFTFLLRAALLFSLPSAFCYWSFLRGGRSVFVQWLWCLAGFLVASAVPVQVFTIEQRILKAWIVVLCVVLLVFVPGILPKFLIPTLGGQRLFRTMNYISIGVLFVINLSRH